MNRIYVASSWRNQHQPKVVKDLVDAGFMVYDFRNPPGRTGFKWSDCDTEYGKWSSSVYRSILKGSPIAAAGFMADFRAMLWCDTCVLVLPCGRSAHLELGYCGGMGKHTIIMLQEDLDEPELMNLLANDIVIGTDELLSVLRGVYHV